MAETRMATPEEEAELILRFAAAHAIAGTPAKLHDYLVEQIAKSIRMAEKRGVEDLRNALASISLMEADMTAPAHEKVRAMGKRARAALHDKEPKMCSVVEYDGAFKCLTHQRTWGAVTSPDIPCDALSKFYGSKP